MLSPVQSRVNSSSNQDQRNEDSQSKGSKRKIEAIFSSVLFPASRSEKKRRIFKTFKIGDPKKNAIYGFLPKKDEKDLSFEVKVKVESQEGGYITFRIFASALADISDVLDRELHDWINPQKPELIWKKEQGFYHPTAIATIIFFANLRFGNPWHISFKQLCEHNFSVSSAFTQLRSNSTWNTSLEQFYEYNFSSVSIEEWYAIVSDILHFCDQYNVKQLKGICYEWLKEKTASDLNNAAVLFVNIHSETHIRKRACYKWVDGIQKYYRDTNKRKDKIAACREVFDLLIRLHRQDRSQCCLEMQECIYKTLRLVASLFLSPDIDIDDANTSDYKNLLFELTFFDFHISEPAKRSKLWEVVYLTESFFRNYGMKMQCIPKNCIPSEGTRAILEICSLLTGKKKNENIELAIKNAKHKTKWKSLIYTLSGFHFFSKRQYTQACKKFTQALLINPQNGYALAYKGQCCNFLHKYDEAFQNFNLALRINPSNCFALMHRGETHKTLFQYENAIEDFLDFLIIAPESLNESLIVRKSLAECFFSLNKYDKAIAQAHILSPTGFRYWSLCMIGFCYTKQNNFAEAQTYLNSALQYKPNDMRAFVYLGYWYLSQNNDEKAFELCCQVLKKQPNSSLSLFMQGVYWMRKKKEDAAEQAFNRALAVNSNCFEANFWRGLLYKNTHEIEKAITDFTQATRLRPHDILVLRHRASCYKMLKKYDQAILDFDKVLLLNPNNWRSLEERGDCFRMLGRYDRAFEDVNAALKFEPYSSVALSTRGSCYLALKQYDKAITDLELALQYNNISNTEAMFIKLALERCRKTLKEHQTKS